MSPAFLAGRSRGMPPAAGDGGPALPVVSPVPIWPCRRDRPPDHAFPKLVEVSEGSERLIVRAPPGPNARLPLQPADSWYVAHAAREYLVPCQKGIAPGTEVSNVTRKMPRKS